MVKRHLWIIAFVVVIFDQVTKFLLLGSKFTLIDGLLYINQVNNTGAGFGILKGQTGLLVSFSIFVIGFILYNLDKVPKQYMVALGLILGGTVGNLIDRVSRGFVIDFIDLTFWPVFNIADSAISIGVAILLILSLFEKKNVTAKRLLKKRELIRNPEK